MSELSLPIGVIFDRFPDPVVLLEGGRVCYANPAARAQLPGLVVDGPVPEPFQELPESGGGLIHWQERGWLVSVELWAGHTLVRLSSPQTASILPDRRVPVLAQKLRLPLTALISSEELLAGLLTPEQRKRGDRYLARSTKAQLRLLRMIRSLELAALSPGELPYGFHPEPVDLKGLLHEAYRQLTDLVQQAGCTISLQEAPGNYYVPCDDELFLVQLYHLVSNALRATGAGGNLVLRLERTKRRALVSVEDDGPGLTPTELAQLFDPTQGGDTLRTAGSGLGLGITVCQKIAQLHQGSLLFANRADRGVRATVSLPLCPPSGGLELHSPVPYPDTSNGFPLVLRELSDVLPETCFLPEDL